MSSDLASASDGAISHPPRRGVLIVVSSPSGAGKTTLCNRLRSEFPELEFSVSYTTRPRRTGEQDGVEYHFVTVDRFQEMIAEDHFAEYAMVHGNMYGTSADQVRDCLARGRDLVFDIDYQGGLALRRRFPDDVILVFILPPSLGELERRLRTRATDAADVIERRLRVARSELAHYDQYDYLIVNDHADRAYDALRAVYISELQRTSRMSTVARAVIADGGEP
jgi:guanylate kinase